MMLTLVLRQDDQTRAFLGFQPKELHLRKPYCLVKQQNNNNNKIRQLADAFKMAQKVKSPASQAQ